MLEFPPVRGVTRTEAAIVGGGWTGLLTAAFLARRGIQVTLVTESLPQDEVVSATLRQPGRYRRIAAWHGDEALRMQVQRMERIWKALPAWLTELCPCREAEAYSCALEERDVPELRAQQLLLTRLGIAALTAPDAGGCPFPVALSSRSSAMLADGELLLDALVGRILQGGGQLLIGRAMNVNPRQVLVSGGRVDAEHVLLCTGKPLGLASQRLLTLLETRTMVSSALTAPVPLHAMHTDVISGLTLMPAPGAVIAHMDAGRTGARPELLRTANFRSLLATHLPDYPAAPPVCRMLTRPLDGLPVAGGMRVPGGQLLVASGAEDFLDAVICAETLTRLMLRRPLDEDLPLRPDRPLPRRLLLTSLTRMRRERAVNALRTFAPRCPHCRCRLRWHGAAGWWGCVGCGSAFSRIGRRIGGAALVDAAVGIGRRGRFAP